MRARVNLIRAGMVAGLLATVATARAYIFESSAWKAGTAAAPTPVTFQLELQNGPPANRTLTDGSTSWNQVAAAALTDWNQYLVTMQYKWVTDSTAAAPVGFVDANGNGEENGNGQNSVSWASSIFGESWGSLTVGITFRIWTVAAVPGGTNPTTGQAVSFNTTTETDVLFNNTVSWDSFRVNLRSVNDLRRVALHEFGHALGLDHPDTNGQPNGFAIMDSMSSNIDDVTADDIGGGQYLYNPLPSITTQPSSQTVTVGGAATFSVVTTNNNAAAFQWRKGTTAISGATGSSLSLTNLSTSDQASYSVLITDRAGTTTSSAAVLTVQPPGPVITTAPASQTVAAGNAVALSVAASGSGLTYQWLLNGTAIAGATGPTYSLPNAGATDAGSYTVVVSNGTSSSTSSAATLTVNTTARLINLSTRANVGTSSLTAGFVIGGSGSKNVLVRGIGPTLGQPPFGIVGALSNPLLKLFDTNGNVLATDTAWGGSAALQQAMAAVGAFPLASNSADSVLTALLPQGGATANVSGINNTQGNALIEVYDEDSITAGARLVNLSVLAFSDTGSGALTAGFVVNGSSSLTLLIRGDGPTLSAFSIGGLLAQPALTVYNSSSAAIASNTGWGGTAKLSTVFSQVGAFPFPVTSADSALLVTLAPGNYSAIVSGLGNATGTAEIEIYEVR